MKKFGTDEIIKLANFLFPEDGDLALFNLVADVTAGKLDYEVIDGLPEIVEDADTDIAVAMGMVTVGPNSGRLSWVFDPDQEAQREILKGLIRGMKPDPKISASFNIARPPHTIAALIACQGKDGDFAYALFRHPDLDHQQALVIMVGCFPAEELDEEPPTVKN